MAHGSWYYEVDFLSQPEESHTRIGWGQAYGNFLFNINKQKILAVLQACLGYSKFSYSWRSLSGTTFHDAYGKHYTDFGYKQGDTLGIFF